MKKLSDYKDEEAIELWADLLDPMTKIIADPEVQKAVQSGKPTLLIAQAILKAHPAEARDIMARIDPEPLNGLNFATRFVGIVMDFINNSDLKDFFASAGQEKTEYEFTGSVMENIAAVEA